MRLPFAMMSLVAFLMTIEPEPHAAAGMGAAAERHAVGVAGDDAHALDRHAEPFGDELREARLVALALRDDADHDSTKPSGSTVISARSRGTPVAVST